MNRKNATILTALLWLTALVVCAQTRPSSFRTSPAVAIENNLLLDATKSINLGVEFKTGARSTILLPASYNPFSESKDKQWRHFLVQPEFRHWLCNAFEGHFFGFHGHYAVYNVSGVPSTWMKEHRVQGWLAGGGLTYGYQFYLSSRFNLETSIGAGYAYLDYDVIDKTRNGHLKRLEIKHYIGPTKAALSLIYIIK